MVKFVISRMTITHICRLGGNRVQVIHVHVPDPSLVERMHDHIYESTYI